MTEWRGILANTNSRARFAAFALLATMFVGGCGEASSESDADSSAEAETEEAAEETVATPVEVTMARRGDIFAAYAGTATLEAFEEATVVAKVEGEVAEIVAEEGDVVKAGDILARLDGDRLRLRLEESRANLAKAERDYNRNVDLHNKGLVASGAFEAIKYDMDALRAAFNIAKLEYDYSTIRAPIDGIISERMIKTGNTIAANTAAFHVVNLQPLVAYLHAPEREFGKLAAGQQVEVAVDALAGLKFSGEVARISPMVDAASGTFKVTVEMGEADTQLKPGMFARLNIIYDRRDNAVLVPRDALMETEVGSSVYVVEDDTAVRKAIELGFSWENDVEVLSGLEAGEAVVTIGQTALKPESKVEVINPATADSQGEAATDAEG